MTMDEDTKISVIVYVAIALVALVASVAMLA